MDCGRSMRAVKNNLPAPSWEVGDKKDKHIKSVASEASALQWNEKQAVQFAR